MSLLQTESQPGFPYDDLTAGNASVLELLLANKDLVDVNHIAAESVRRVYKVGHKSITVAGRILEFEARQLRAIDQGAAMYEAMSAMVNVTPGNTSVFKMSDFSAGLEGEYDSDKIQQYFTDAYDCFRNENPIAVQVLRDASRLPEPMAEYAVMGAGVSRHFEIDTNEAS